MIKSLDRIGSVGALLAAVAAPCCLPIFAGLAGALGITALGLNESVVFYALQAFALLSVIGLLLAAGRHRSVVLSRSGLFQLRRCFLLSMGCFPHRLFIWVSPDYAWRVFGII
jgi:hypothetical protein